MAWETGTSFTDRFLPALSGETKPGLGGTPADLLGGSFKAGGAALGLGLGSLKNSPQALKSLMSSLANKSKSVFNKGTQKFKDMKQFKGQYEPMIPSNVALNLKGKLSGIPSAAAFKALMNSPEGKRRLIAMGITAPAALMIMNSPSSFFDDKSSTKGDGLTEQQRLLMAGGSDSGRRGKATLDPQHKSRYGGEFKPTTMQKLGANMKNPEWWSESISGLPSDTRLMRLGQLMDYYGKTPKGRKDSDDPSKLWAANEAASAKIQATKDAANKPTKPTSILSKLGGKELDAAIRPLVEKQLGYSDFIPFNQASSDEVDRDVALVKTLVQQYHTVDGMPINEAIDKAVKQVQNTNIPVLPFF
jgi:hypothetical protein